MTCDQFDRMWARHEADLLERAEAQGVSDHLGSCARCRDRASALQLAISSYKDAPAGHPSPEVWQRIEAGIEREMTKRPEKARGFGWLAPAWGLAVAALILVAFFVRPQVPGLRIVRLEGVARVDGRAAVPGIALNDGSLVETEEGARLIVSGPGPVRIDISGASRFHISKSEVKLHQGEGRFEVSDAGASFLVSTGAASGRGGRGRFTVAVLNPLQADFIAIEGDLLVDTLRKQYELPGGKILCVTNGEEFTVIPGEDYSRLREREQQAWNVGHRYGNLVREKVEGRDFTRARTGFELSRTSFGESGDQRRMARLTEGFLEGGAGVGAESCASFRGALAAILLEARQAGLPPEWLLVDMDELIQRKEAIGLKKRLVQKTKAFLADGAQGRLVKIMSDDDDEDDENEQED